VRVLVDTNVVLDVLLDRRPFSEAATQVFALIEESKIEGYLCATTVTTVDYLLGTVTLAAPPAGSVTVTGKYLPKIALPACRSYSLNLTKAQLETTVYGDDFVDRISGLGDASGTLERLETGLEDYTTGESFWDAFLAGVPVGLEERYDDATTTYCTRLYVQLESLPQSAAPGDLATAVVGFQGVTWGNSDKSISIGDPA
jgi:predicted nucleic acid-binding protein